MNILYIGPYRQKSINGISSLIVLQNILQNKKHKISCRPIYIDNSATTEININDILVAEKTNLDKYEVVIQNVPIDVCETIEGVENILIPIINEKRPDNNLIHKIQKFDYVLTDSGVVYNRLSSYYKKSTNKVYDYNLPIPINRIQEQQFNIGSLSKTNKFYFIGDYKNNITNIENLCRSFIMNVSVYDSSLILYLLNMDLQLKNEISNTINDIYNDLGIKYAINRIIIAPIDCTFDNLLTAHQTSNIFIDLQDDNTNVLNVKLANLLNKPIISFYEDHETGIYRNKKLYKECFGVSEQSINQKIKQALSSKEYKSIIPFSKKQHINNII